MSSNLAFLRDSRKYPWTSKKGTIIRETAVQPGNMICQSSFNINRKIISIQSVESFERAVEKKNSRVSVKSSTGELARGSRFELLPLRKIEFETEHLRARNGNLLPSFILTNHSISSIFTPADILRRYLMSLLSEYSMCLHPACPQSNLASSLKEEMNKSDNEIVRKRMGWKGRWIWVRGWRWGEKRSATRC